MSTIIKILLVDEPTLLQDVSAVLQSEGYAVTEASTGQDALRRAEELFPDLILLDEELPDMDSAEVCRRLRAIPTLEETVVVLLSGADTGAGDQGDALAAGADVYLARPAFHRDSLAWIGACLGSTQHLPAGVAQRGRERRYPLLLNVANDLIFCHELTTDGSLGTFTEVNESACQVLGYSREELLQMSPADLLTAVDRQRIPRAVRELRASGTLLFERKLVTKAGDRVPVEFHSSVFEVDGRLRVLSVGRDISARKQAQAQFRFQSQILRNVRDSIIVTDVDWNITYWNQGATAVFGYEADEMIGKTPAVLYPTLNPDDLAEDIQHILERREYRDRWKGRHKDGSVVWVDIRTTPMYDDGGNLAGFIGVAKDITERVHAEEALREANGELERRVEEQTAELQEANERLRMEIAERKQTEQTLRKSEERFRIVSELTSDFAYSIRLQADESIEFEWVTQALTDITGYTLEELEHAGRDVVHPDDFPIIDRHRAALFSGEEVTSQYRIRTKSDEIRWLEDHGKPVWDERGEQIIGIIGAVRDITERRQAKEEVRRQREELAHVMRVASLGELSASLAHELNQPLTAILSNAQAAQRFLAEDQPDLAETGAILSDIVEDSRRAGDVIRRMRRHLQRGDLQREVLDVNELLRGVMSLIRNEAAANDVSVEYGLADDFPPVAGDRTQLQQVLMNLVLNAIEAMHEMEPGARRLVVRSGVHESDMIEIAIQDNGVGIEADVTEQLFEPFYTTKADGIGMGLAISQSIVRAHGGRLWATPNSEQGMTFHVTLPVHEKAAL